MKQCYEVQGVPKSAHSHVVKAGNFLFTTGQMGRDIDGKLLDGIENQTRQALKNLKTVVEAAGSSLENVVRITVFVTNLEDVAKMNDVYFGEFFPDNRPARTCVEVSGIALGALLELDAVVYCE
jgi:2-iminobutanoate/2-iminopropanoate deaminase